MVTGGSWALTVDEKFKFKYLQGKKDQKWGNMTPTKRPVPMALMEELGPS